MVHVHTDRFAMIAISPPLLARLLFGRRSEDRFAVRVASCWFFDDSGERVPEHIDRAIRRELAAVRSATAPPS